MKHLEYIDQIRKDEKRNKDFLHLTVNENRLSSLAASFLDSELSERYYFGSGTPDREVFLGAFSALGMPHVGALIEQAEAAAKKMLHADIVNLNCLSGVHAMMCAILSMTEPGDVVMSVHKDHGGHFATKGIIERVGRKHVFTSYDRERQRFDIDAILETCQKNNVRAVYLDVSYYLDPHDIVRMRSVLGDAIAIIYDASHTMGLIMGGAFQAPLLEGADAICANTHKTLPGPQKGMIAFRDGERGRRANAIIEGCLYSSPHAHHLIALSISILEMEAFGKQYAQDIIDNSNALGEALASFGYTLRTANTGRFSENHQVHLMTESIGDYQELFHACVSNGITLNFDNAWGGDMFIRLGTQEITRRGMGPSDMHTIACFLHGIFSGKDIVQEVSAFNASFPDVHYGFDANDLSISQS